MQFEWDERKWQINLKKHRLDFADAGIVFSGVVITILDNRFSYGEDRWFSLGLLDDVVVAIAHTDRKNHIRIISMRKATKHESQIYFSQIAKEAGTTFYDESESQDGN